MPSSSAARDRSAAGSSGRWPSAATRPSGPTPRSPTPASPPRRRRPGGLGRLAPRPAARRRLLPGRVHLGRRLRARPGPGPRGQPRAAAEPRPGRGRVGARFVYFSTDYVFDGRGGPYAEDAPDQPPLGLRPSQARGRARPGRGAGRPPADRPDVLGLRPRAAGEELRLPAGQGPRGGQGAGLPVGPGLEPELRPRRRPGGRRAGRGGPFGPDPRRRPRGDGPGPVRPGARRGLRPRPVPDRRQDHRRARPGGPPAALRRPAHPPARRPPARRDEAAGRLPGRLSRPGWPRPKGSPSRSRPGTSSSDAMPLEAEAPLRSTIEMSRTASDRVRPRPPILRFAIRGAAVRVRSDHGGSVLSTHYREVRDDADDLRCGDGGRGGGRDGLGGLAGDHLATGQHRLAGPGLHRSPTSSRPSSPRTSRATRWWPGPWPCWRSTRRSRGASSWSPGSFRATLRKMKFEAFDRHLGMLLGGLEGAILGMVVTFFVVSLAPQTRDPIFASPSGKLVASVIDAVGPALPVGGRRCPGPVRRGGQAGRLDRREGAPAPARPPPMRPTAEAKRTSHANDGTVERR